MSPHGLTDAEAELLLQIGAALARIESYLSGCEAPKPLHDAIGEVVRQQLDKPKESVR